MLADEGVAAVTARRVAEAAGTSVPAVYELFGDKRGLVREVFFEGFRRLGTRLATVQDTDDARADLDQVLAVLRRFVRKNPELTEVMFSRPFADFDPGPDELGAGSIVRECIVGHVRRCIDAGQLVGNAPDIAHVLLALAQGLAAQESAGWLGTSAASVNRRWALAFRAALGGVAGRRETDTM